jgi:DNA-binding NtrC family response regulator
MTEEFSVCLIDDEERMLRALEEGFALSEKVKFKLSTASSLDEFLVKDFVNHHFDILVIDLLLSAMRSPEEMEGFFLLFSLSELQDAEHRIVYSAFPQTANVVRAMQLGATDFVSKVECPPHKFVERVERMIQGRQRQAKDQQMINAFIEDNRLEWAKKKSGMFLAIAVDRSASQVRARQVAAGRSRLETLMKYDRCRSENGWMEFLPLYPYLHRVPSPGE